MGVGSLTSQLTNVSCSICTLVSPSISSVISKAYHFASPEKAGLTAVIPFLTPLNPPLWLSIADGIRASHMVPPAGVVTLIQRFGSALNLDVHLHMLILDGVSTHQPDRPRFNPVTVPDTKMRDGSTVSSSASSAGSHATAISSKTSNSLGST
jgi:Putative transposase